jgi:subfamily B ATP-binding cassette protein MsbA
MNPFPGALHYFAVFRRYVGRRLYIVFALTAVAGIAEGFGIALLLPLLSVLDVHGAPSGRVASTMTAAVEWLGLTGSLFGVLGLIASLFIVKGAVQFANAAYVARLQARLARELRARLFDAFGRMDYLYCLRGNTGHFVNVIGTQTNTFFSSCSAFIHFTTKTIMTAIYLGAATAVAWRFGLLAVVLGSLLLLLFRSLNQRVRELSRQSAREASRLNKLLVQALQAFKYLASTNQLGRLRAAVVESIGLLSDQVLRKQVASAFTNAIIEPVSVAFLMIILAVQVLVFEQPIAPLLVAIVLFYRGMTSVVGIQVQWQMMLAGVGAVEIIRDELDALHVHREQGGGTVLQPLSRGIAFRNVRFAYSPQSGDVLRDVSLMIPVRSTAAFVGESGAGKSTLVDLLTLLLKPQHGEILIDGVEGHEVELASWRSQIGYVSQDTVVFDDTIGANISLALEGRDTSNEPGVMARVREAAHRANLAAFIERLPEGYNTVVGERGLRLSGGQRQRLFIARELFKSPNLLILDEATSALDTEAERAVQESIDALHGQITVVMIAHRLSTIRNVDHVYVLEGGRVIEQGAYMDLRARTDSRFRKMIDLQTV